ncbi:Mas-related G-protein coupled receptor member X2 [Tupaia chinensis]|uniref:Mas-related G-protein coupled receptor member X2 n=1 Tax=Tupaia chinensis TaxID=246437 RepID=L9L6L5_TUPCH|nr:Mas-related G-protein coupled receptor member X2 [Tupaia chinensis]
MNSTIPAWGVTFTPRNGNDRDFPPTSNMKTWIFNLLTVIIGLIGLAGNAVVLWLLGFRMRRNAFSVYILNLAGADFLLLCTYVVYSLLELMNIFVPNIIYHIVFMTVTISSYIAGLSILSAISTERCLSVLCPIWYRCRRPRHLSAVMCALLWALSLLMNIFIGSHCRFLFMIHGYYQCTAFYFIIPTWLIFLFVVLSGSSLTVLARFLCGSRKMPLTRLYVTILVTMLVYLLCALPPGIVWFGSFWVDIHFDRTEIILSVINSRANPIIYFFVGSWRRQQRQGQPRQSLKLVLQNALEDKAEVWDSKGGLPPETRGSSGSSVM